MVESTVVGAAPDATGDEERSADPVGRRARRRRQNWALAIAAVLLLGSGVVLLSAQTYTSEAVVDLAPVSLQDLAFADQPPLPRDDAFASEIERIDGPEIRPQVEGQLTFPLHFQAEAGDQNDLHLTASADNPGDAKQAAEVLANTYLANRRDPTALQLGVEGTTQRLSELGMSEPFTGPPPAGATSDQAAEITTLQRRLQGQQDGVTAVRAGDTAVLVRAPALDLHPAMVPLALILAGLVVGLVALIRSLGREIEEQGPVSASAAWTDLGERIRARSGRPVALPALAGLAALVVLRAAVYAAMGVGLMADDWLIRANLDRFGLFGTTSGLALSARALPVAWLSYNLTFGLAGNHPLVLLAMGTALNIAVVGLLYVLLDRIFTSRIALLAVAVWVLVPNHSSLTVWAATVQARTGLILLFCGLLLLLRGRGWLPVTLCFVAAAFSYELTVPVSVAAAALLPTAGTLTWRRRGAILACVGAAALWLRAHPHYPIEIHIRNPIFVWSGHFGAGFLGSVTPPLQVRLLLGAVVAAGAVVCVGLWCKGDRRWDRGPAVAMSGLVVMVLGLATISSTAAALDRAETGSADRLFTVSSIGAALLLAGIGLTIYQRRRSVAFIGAAALLALCAVGTLRSARTWHQGAHMAAALIGYLPQAADDPANTHYVVVPNDPWRMGVVGQTSWTATPALHQRYGDGDGWVNMIDEHPNPIAPDEVVVDWHDVLGHDLPPEPGPPGLDPEWKSGTAAREQSICAAIVAVTGEGC